MTERTTIQIDTEQKEQLDEIKRIDGESYKSVIGLLIANYNNEQDATTNQATEAVDTEEIAEQLQMDSTEDIVKRIDDLETELKSKIEALQRA